MKKYPSIFILLFFFLLLISCGSKASKRTEMIDDTTNIKKNIEAESKLNVYFKVVMLNKVENQDERDGTDSQSAVELWVDNKKVDSYNEFGDGYIFENGLQANVKSEMSEKIYSISIIDSMRFKVECSMIFEGEENVQWSKIYSKKNTTDWKMTHCSGQCD